MTYQVIGSDDDDATARFDSGKMGIHNQGRLSVPDILTNGRSIPARTLSWAV